MTALLVMPVAAPIVAALVSFASGRHRPSAVAATAAAVVIAVCGCLVAATRSAQPAHAIGGLLRADALTATLPIVRRRRIMAGSSAAGPKRTPARKATAAIAAPRNVIQRVATPQIAGRSPSTVACPAGMPPPTRKT